MKTFRVDFQGYDADETPCYSYLRAYFQGVNVEAIMGRVNKFVKYLDRNRMPYDWQVKDITELRK